MRVLRIVEATNVAVKMTAIFTELEEHVKKIDKELNIDVEASFKDDIAYFNVTIKTDNREKYFPMPYMVSQVTYDIYDSSYYLYMSHNHSEEFDEASKIDFIDILKYMKKEAERIIKYYRKG